MSNTTTEQRFWSKVNKTVTCWNWSAATTEGYGQFYIMTNGKRKLYQAHRVSLWLLGKTNLTAAKDFSDVVDHVCRNRLCVRPSHLRVVTARQNALENNNGKSFLNSKKTHCKWGHEFNYKNTYLYKKRRSCRACNLSTKRGEE